MARLRVLAAPAAFTGAYLLLVPALANAYWIQVLTAATVFAVVAMSLGLLVGRVGLISLGQVAILALGGWIALRLGYGTNLPFAVIVLVSGLITGVLGTIVGLPTLRVSGLYFALITLMAAAAITIALGVTKFPNGGSGFLGFDVSLSGAAQLRRPAIAEGDAAYFRYVAVAAALLFALAALHLRTAVGRGWAAIRQSEPSALAAGVDVSMGKLWAFALASFMAGAAGALLASTGGGLTTYQFPVESSITLLAVVLMCGAYSLWGAVLVAVFTKVLPGAFQVWGVSSNVLLILFGVGVLQVLLTSPRGIAGQLPKDVERLRRALRGGSGDRGRVVEPRSEVES